MAHDGSQKRFLTTPEAAEHIGVAPGTLRNWRNTSRHAIPFQKLGRKVSYRLADLDKWLEAHRVDPSAA